MLVLERSDRVGGCARTDEIAPGFRCPTLAHAAAIDPALVRTLGLEAHGLRIVRPAADACAPTNDGRALILWHDAARAAPAIRAFSAKDAEQYPRFLDSFAQDQRACCARWRRRLPPSIDNPTAGDLIELLKTGRTFRALGKADAYRLLRWMPMAVADLASEWFESEPLRATIAAGGVLGSFLGPWSAGSAAVLLMLGAGEGHPVASGWFVAGGPGRAGRRARRSRAPGRRRDQNRRRGRAGSRRPTAASTGVTLASATRSRRAPSCRTPIRNERCSGLLDPMHLEPEIVRRIQNIRTHGTLAKINYAVSSLPRFRRRRGAPRRGARACVVRTHPPGARHRRHRARVRRGQIRRLRRRAVDRADDPVDCRPDARARWPARRLGVRAVRAVSPARDELGRRTRSPRGRGDADDRRATRRASSPRSSPATVITPLDLERTYGLTGGHIFHGELSLDQWFVTRPLARLGALPHADRAALSLRLGDASGHRAGWAIRRAGREARS